MSSWWLLPLTDHWRLWIQRWPQGTVVQQAVSAFRFCSWRGSHRMKHPGAHSLLHRVLQIERHNTLLLSLVPAGAEVAEWSDKRPWKRKWKGINLAQLLCAGCRLGVLRCATGAARGWLWFWDYHLLAVWTWMGSLTSVDLSFLMSLS